MTEVVLNKCVADHFLTGSLWGVGRDYIYYLMQGSGISTPWEFKLNSLHLEIVKYFSNVSYQLPESLNTV